MQQEMLVLDAKIFSRSILPTLVRPSLLHLPRDSRNWRRTSTITISSEVAFRTTALLNMLIAMHSEMQDRLMQTLVLMLQTSPNGWRWKTSYRYLLSLSSMVLMSLMPTARPKVPETMPSFLFIRHIRLTIPLAMHQSTLDKEAALEGASRPTLRVS